ncbi:hypothetical protein Tdes44962_MAKER04548 [Teratosphaeria destructans]|uniref:Uncharacterized protein n=1 Tax=Teratosphaeria destructans TaxID=418781 RepID=A0A9W7SMD8_9PEZI|nr:hypothetical protein Tdes44962_MAKER04548 [Teratosphaeria destructans]
MFSSIWLYTLVAATGISGAQVSNDLGNVSALAHMDLKREAAEELATVQRENGGLDIVLKSSLADSDAPTVKREEQVSSHVLNKRASTPDQVCGELSWRGCELRLESAKCISKTEYQVYCAGCYRYGDPERVHQKVGKNVCPPKTLCFDVPGINIWNEAVPQVLCLPVGQTMQWTATTKKLEDTRTCSPGLTNKSGRELKVEAVVRSMQSNGKEEVTAKRVAVVLDGKALDGEDMVGDFTTDLVLRHTSSIQGCITTQGKFNQIVEGMLGLRFLG